MLFKETFDRLIPEVRAAVEELFTAIYKEQTHPQDILLTEVGHCDEQSFPGYKRFGPGMGGWAHEAEHTQYEFYDLYRRQYQSVPRTEFYAQAKENQAQLKEVRLSIQLEMMIYLRFWETDRLLTKLYHYTQLVLGKNFDWQYRIANDDSRQGLIRLEVRDKLQSRCPKYYALLKKIYRSQIRNAVAHSQYYVTDNNLGFTNYEKDTYADLTQKPFDWWEEIFHSVILFYNELIHHQEQIHDRAKGQDDLSLGAGIEVRFTDPTRGEEQFVHWTFNHKRGIWDWAPPRTQSGLYV